MKLSEFKFSISVETYDEKTAENDRNCYFADKAHSFQTITDISPKFKKKHKFMTWMKIVFKFHAPILYSSREISRQIALRSGRVGSNQFIISNDSASSIMIIKIYLNFFRFFSKVLELFECHRGNPYMNVNRKCVRFAHS